MTYDAWIMIQPDGRLLIDTRDFANEAEVWRIVLGWPDEQEIRNARAVGYRVKLAQVTVKVL